MAYKHEEEHFLPNDDAAIGSHHSRYVGFPWIVHMVLLFIYTSIFIYFGNELSFTRSCDKELSAWSPLLDIVKYRTVEFKGSFDSKSEWKGPPSPEVDAAWKEITGVETVSANIQEAQILKLQKSVDASKTPDGDYLVGVEVVHQLHCLDMLRRWTYPEYYGNAGMFRHKDLLRNHTDHCIDMLRQNLICTSDVSLVTHNWVKGFEMPQPNFNVVHKCRNFDDILRYVKEHSRNWTRSDFAMKPEDIVELDHLP
ncbi:hypothetical protein BP6252_03801 [Coleophoma cylindrospora]|uniref:Tat pathway signal sequence protein n=1 Tax=Coleophoma cylindrospora TaxID=1849047 RepID=A0A3D8S8L8_9HELO|nr:hypothetical protein BP6252_03801 [Coleophoma cylindrospora]